MVSRALSIFLCITAAGTAAMHPAIGQTMPSAERGAQVAAMWCSSCHATGAVSQGSDVAPTFTEIAHRRSPDYIRGFLANPHVRGSMPPFDLAREHTEDLVAYFESLK